MLTQRIALLASVGFLLAGSSEAQNQHFTDLAPAKGVDLLPIPGDNTVGMSGGMAWVDYDNDGDEDLFCPSGNGANRLFRNDAGDFNEVTQDAQVETTLLNSVGASAADFDQDGWVDIYLTNRGPNGLLRNLADGSFEEVAEANGVLAPGWSTSASWADFDLDGDLDLYVGNYIKQIQFPYHIGDPNNLYINQGAGASPRFVDRAEELGVDNRTVFTEEPDIDVNGFYLNPFPLGEDTAGCTLSVCTADYDEDGDPDLLVGNDFGAWIVSDRLFRNDFEAGNGLAFSDVTEETGFDPRPLYNMGINAADYDHDGDWDFYFSNLGDNVFLRNDGGVFTEVADQAGVLDGVDPGSGLLITSWGTIWGDFDNDGWEDLLVVNGFVPAAPFITNEKDAHNSLFMNDGDGTFTRLDSELSGIADAGAARGVGMTDVDFDGWLDFYVADNGFDAVIEDGDQNRLYRNNRSLGDADNQWLELRLRGTRSNLEGLGARVEAEVAGDTLKRLVLGDPVYISSGSRMVHFGLGKSPRVDRLRVIWPSGTVQQWVDVRAERQLEFREASVLLRKLKAPRLTSQGMQLTAQIANLGGSDSSYEMSFELLRPGGQVVGLTAIESGTIGANELGEVQTVFALNQVQIQALAGERVDIRVRLRSQRAMDSERFSFELK